MILSGTLVATLLWANPRNLYVWVLIFVTLGFGAIGFYDDYLKVTKQSHKGFSGKSRLALEAAIAITACIMIAQIATPGLSNRLALPFAKEILFDLGWFYLAFAAFVIVGAGNAVNITDGLDGLAIVPVMIVAGTFGFIAYLVGNAIYRQLSPGPFRARRRRARRRLRRAHRRRARLPVVQRAAGPDLHGRYRLACARRAARRRSRSRPRWSSCSPSSAGCSCSRPCR